MTSRTELLKTLREATHRDLWLTSYALFRLTEDVDLGCLMGLVESVLEAAEEEVHVPTPVSRLLAERFGLES